jgi:hypothetical protein
MTVSDIYDRVRAITYLPDEPSNFEYITDAVEVLSNKGDWDALIGYLVIQPNANFNDTSGDIITLPRQVEVPLSVNIDDHPTFTRDRFYEFTLNGPGSNAEQTNWSWIDRGMVPTFRPLFPPGTNLLNADPQNITVSGSAVDNGAEVVITGVVGADGKLFSEVLTLGTKETTDFGFFTIERVTKPETIKQVSLYDGAHNALGIYDPDETDPQYRQIRISKPGATAYIQFRRTRFKVKSQNDFIPIRSKWGLLYMIKSLKALADEKPDLAAKLEAQALKLASEEQASHNKHVERASQAEIATVRNLSYNNIDSIIVADIYDETCKITGPIGEQKVYDRITEAVLILGRKAQWDSMRGYVDIQTDQYDYVTLPRYVDTVIKLNINGSPADMKNKWYEFHLNGPGGLDWYELPCNSWVDVGYTSTIRDVLYPQTLTLEADLDVDNNVTVRIEGYYQGKWIMTPDPKDSSKLIDGFTVDGATPVDRITRIIKGSSKGFIKLIGTKVGDPAVTNVLGYWMPDELEPNYRKIKLPRGCERVRIMYRMRDRKVQSLTDPLHLRSKTAILTQLKANELLMSAKSAADLQQAEALEAKALRYLIDEQLISNQSEVRSINFGPNFTPSDEFIQC